jgi:SAM-dependent methyltransferase
MGDADRVDPGYPETSAGRLELIWGEGFLSPGGPAEVARILDGADLTGCDVLDIGSGTGGVDVVLVRDHAAGTVTGVDVEQRLVDVATERARALGLDDRVSHHLVAPGPLPFADQSFDVVFSKDAILHVPDKEEIYSEALRVLRPGGRLLVSDWLRGEGDAVAELVQEFVAASGHDFTMVSLDRVGEIVRSVGFVDVELEDRHAWYLEEAEAELAALRGPLRPQFLERWGEEATDDETAFWEVLVEALRGGAMRPGHVRASKPAG